MITAFPSPSGSAHGDAAPAADFPSVETLEALGVHTLLPDALAPWRPLLAEALLAFLHRLPAARLDDLIGRQLALDAEAAPAQRLAAVLACCPTLHKLGQVLARQRHLHPELRSRLQALESMPPSLPASALARRVRRELGGRSRALALHDAALAEGSVAVVLPFAWREGGRLREGVLKVLKPGIETRLAQELALLPGIADLIERRSAELGLPRIDCRGPLASVDRLLREEIRLDREQLHLAAAAAFHRGDARVHIPALLPWCTPRITAMEHIRGSALERAALEPPARRRLASTMVSALLARPFWSTEAFATFHGDLHGGNLLLGEDGRLAILDWSLIARVSKAQREAMIEIALGGIGLDVAAIQAGLRTLGLSGLPQRRVGELVEAALDRAVCGARPIGFDWLLRLLDELALAGGSGFDAQLSLLRKSWLTLSGVIADLGVDASPDATLLHCGLSQFLAEWPQRLFTAPTSRAFATHVSNADLALLAGSGWTTWARYWTRLARAGAGAADLMER